MVSNVLKIGPIREMATVWWGLYTHTPITKWRKINRKLSPQQASRILWVWIFPGGSSKERTRQLHQITATWDDIVMSMHIKKQDAWFYFQTTVKKSFKFPLISTSMNEKQCHYIESPSLCLDLQATGLPLDTQRTKVAGLQHPWESTI